MTTIEPAAGAKQPLIGHRRVLAIALPMTLANMSTPLLGVVATAVIGQLGEAHLLGAIALASVLFDVVFWPFGFLRMGTTGLTAQAVGAGDEREKIAALFRALLIALAAGLGVVALQGPIGDLMFRLFGPSVSVEEAARRYYEIRVWSAPAAFANYAILGWFLGQGRATLGLLLQALLNGLNAALAVLFVLGLHMSVEGAAYGALIGECGALLVGLACVGRTIGALPKPTWRVVLDQGLMARTVIVNGDVFVRTVALLAAYMFFAAQGARAGDATLAANAILNNLFLIGGYFLDGFATAAEALCGAAVGARDRTGFERAVRLAMVWCLGIAAVISILFFFIGGLFIDFVAKSEEVREAARPFLPYAAAAPLVAAPAFVLDGVFIGATWGKAMRDTSLIAIALYLAAFWLLSPSLGNHGLWLAFVGWLAFRWIGQAALLPGLRRRTFGS